jgi:hypothetical protein
MRLILGVLVGLLVGSLGSFAGESDIDIYQLGLADGWMESMADTIAIQQYHDCVERLPATAQRDDFCGCWRTQKDAAASMTAQWYATPANVRAIRGINPFWRRDVGVPRSLVWNDQGEPCH